LPHGSELTANRSDHLFFCRLPRERVATEQTVEILRETTRFLAGVSHLSIGSISGLPECLLEGLNTAEGKERAKEVIPSPWLRVDEVEDLSPPQDVQILTGPLQIVLKCRWQALRIRLQVKDRPIRIIKRDDN
jgi:hypothetical protein